MNHASIIALAVLTTIAPLPVISKAETYPARPVRVIVPGPAGGGLDVVARIVMQSLSESSRAQFFIENLPGAGGATGTGTAANTQGDGYTLLVINQDFVIHPLTKSKVPYDTLKSFSPISLLAAAPEMLLVNPSVPARNMRELATLLKANPGKYNYATPGYGTSPHLANERLFKLTLGTDVVHVPFQGAPPAVVSTIAGDTQILHITLPLVAPHVKEGRLRALAVASLERSALFPDVPTLTESGIPGHEVGFWVALMAPAGIPQPAAEWLQRQLKQALSQPASKEKLAALGFELIASTPDNLSLHIKAETERWSKVVREAGIKIN
jgi:tripartite-type tricarboxylate transporter receptor subunit TctC